ncbi:MAG: TonB family protein [Nitrospira sp.]|nr:TonB family protein [Nitrospira sp.]
MNTLSIRHPGEIRSYAQSLALSVLIHGLIITFAVTVLSDLKLAPEPEPFKWDVAMVDRPVPKQVETPSEANVATPAPPPPKPAPAQPVTEAVQTVQTVQQVVHQEVREVRRVVQTSAQPTQVVSRAVQPVQALQQVAAPTEAVAPEGARPAASESSAGPAAQAVETAQTPTVAQAVAARPTAPAVVQQASIKELPVRSVPETKADYGWLAEALWHRVEQLKRYPHLARMNRWEGKVILRAVIKEDGQLVDLEVAETSGYAVLDHDALEVMRQASPLKLKHPLGKPQVVVQVPISYKLH